MICLLSFFSLEELMVTVRLVSRWCQLMVLRSFQTRFHFLKLEVSRYPNYYADSSSWHTCGDLEHAIRTGYDCFRDENWIMNLRHLKGMWQLKFPRGVNFINWKDSPESRAHLLNILQTPAGQQIPSISPEQVCRLPHFPSSFRAEIKISTLLGTYGAALKRLELHLSELIYFIIWAGDRQPEQTGYENFGLLYRYSRDERLTAKNVDSFQATHFQNPPLDTTSFILENLEKLVVICNEQSRFEPLDDDTIRLEYKNRCRFNNISDSESDYDRHDEVEMLAESRLYATVADGKMLPASMLVDYTIRILQRKFPKLKSFDLIFNFQFWESLFTSGHFTPSYVDMMWRSDLLIILSRFSTAFSNIQFNIKYEHYYLENRCFKDLSRPSTMIQGYASAHRPSLDNMKIVIDHIVRAIKKSPNIFEIQFYENWETYDEPWLLTHERYGVYLDFHSTVGDRKRAQETIQLYEGPQESVQEGDDNSVIYDTFGSIWVDFWFRSTPKVMIFNGMFLRFKSYQSVFSWNYIDSLIQQTGTEGIIVRKQFTVALKKYQLIDSRKRRFCRISEIGDNDFEELVTNQNVIKQLLNHFSALSTLKVVVFEGLSDERLAIFRHFLPAGVTLSNDRDELFRRLEM